MLKWLRRGLHVTVRTSTRLDFLEFIRLLQATSFASSDPHGRRLTNTGVGLHHPVNVETEEHCSNCNKKHCKNVKNVVFACILRASCISISDKIVSFSGIFVVASCHLECFCKIESAYREDSAAEFFCAILAGDSVLDNCSCRTGVPNQGCKAASQGVRDGHSDFCVALLSCHAQFIMW